MAGTRSLGVIWFGIVAIGCGADAVEGDVDAHDAVDAPLDARDAADTDVVADDGGEVETGPVECLDHVQCDDGLTCTVDRCAGSRCQHVPDHGACPAGSFCTAEGACRDAGSCGGDAECDDGVACNGSETCVGGTCAAGAPVACDDTIECTEDLCVEAYDGCRSYPRDDRCPSGERCDAEEGRCVPHDCRPGEIVRCYTGPAGTAGIGVCRGGFQSCGEFTPGACEGQILPGGEICNGLDDDCNGEVDEMEPPLCPLQNGVCSGSRRICGGSLGFLACDYLGWDAAYEPIEQSCDGLDNNCDGFADAGLVAPLCPLQQGVCARARARCQSGAFVCDGAQYGPSWELDEATCDGLDNDCDGAADESLDRPLCSFQEGVCVGARARCGGAGGFLDCGEEEYGGSWEPAEATCDGRDNDCDGSTDESITRTCTFGCGDGIETCRDGGFEGCDAPPITRVRTMLTVGDASFNGLLLDDFLVIAPGSTVTVTCDVRLNTDAGRLILGAGARLVVGGDMTLPDRTYVYGNDATIEVAGTLRVAMFAAILAGADLRPWGVDEARYSAGGAPACFPRTAGAPAASTGGGGGGSGGGAGGDGGRCADSTYRTGDAGAGGGADGADGCNCDCGANAAGGAPMGGAGGVGTAGGGGGGAGGAGGRGANSSNERYGRPAGNSGGAGGAAAPGPGAGVPTTGGGGGGGAGATSISMAACGATGGGGAGILRFRGGIVENLGTISADGVPGGSQNCSGGSGGGGGGTLVFQVRELRNRSVISAQGGRGGSVSYGSCWGCGGFIDGPGGGGGGGRLWIEASDALECGVMTVNGGTGFGAADCMSSSATGAAGWIYTSRSCP